MRFVRCFLTVPLFLKDRKKERILYKQAVKVPGVKKYLVVFGLGSAFCIGLNCLMMLSALALSSFAYSDVDMQTNVGRAVDLYGGSSCRCGKI